MKCPHCERFPTSVKQTTMPLDEGLGYGQVKRRLRKCGNCQKNFTTFEIYEGLYEQIQPATKAKLRRQPLLMENTERKPRKRRKKTGGSD